MARHRPTIKNNWRSSNRTGRPYRRNSHKLGKRGTIHPWTGDAFPTNHSKAEGTSCPHWTCHTEGTLMDSIERSSPPWGTGGSRLHQESTHWGKWTFPACRRGDPGALAAGKSAMGPGEVPSEEPPRHLLAKQAKEAKWKQWGALKPFAQAWWVKREESSSPGKVYWRQAQPSHAG